MALRKTLGAVGWIMMTLIFSAAAAQDQSPKSIADVARENREARLRKAVEQAVAEMCSKADDPKVRETYPRIQEKCTDKPALIQAAFESALKKLKQATQENVKRTEDGLANQTAPADAVGRALATVPPSTQVAASSAGSERNDVENIQKTIDDLKGLTARQLGDRFAGDIQFPGRPEWESRLSVARDKFVAAMQADLDVQKSNSTKPARDHVDYLLSLAQLAFADVQAEGTSKAADWSRKTRK